MNELYTEMKEISADIKKDLTPFGIWTIWIPLTIACAVFLVMAIIIIKPCQMIDKWTNGLFPKSIIKIKNLLFKSYVKFDR